MRIIKKFESFKSKLSSQDQDGLENIEPVESSELGPLNDLEEDEEDNLIYSDDDLDDDDLDVEEEDSEEEDREYEEEEVQEEEEEAYQYIGVKLMNELSQRLGSDIINNQITYDGKIINYFSETECFHIGSEKFETVDDVVDYLTQGENGEEEE